MLAQLAPGHVTPGRTLYIGSVKKRPAVSAVSWTMEMQRRSRIFLRLRFRRRILIPRYTRQEMGQVWSDANKFAKWLEVELAATETLAEDGQVPKEAPDPITARAEVNV